MQKSNYRKEQSVSRDNEYYQKMLAVNPYRSDNEGKRVTVSFTIAASVMEELYDAILEQHRIVYGGETWTKEYHEDALERELTDEEFEKILESYIFGNDYWWFHQNCVRTTLRSVKDYNKLVGGEGDE